MVDYLGEVCYTGRCLGERNRGVLLLNAVDQHNIHCGQSAPYQVDSRPAVRLDNDGKLDKGRFVFMLKICSKCKQAKPVEEFWQHQKTKDGLYPYCKSCYRLVRKKYAEMTDEQRANKAARVLKNYYNHHEERLQRFREYRQENKAKLRKGKTVRYHRRRALELNCEGSFTNQEWEALLEKYNNRCLNCGKKASDTPEGKLTRDHIIPLSLGGTNYIDNIQPLCSSCNAKKHTKIIDYRSAPARPL